MKITVNRIILGLLITTVFSLSGCGGGGSDAVSAPPVVSTETFQLKTAYINDVTATKPPSSVVISGTVSGNSVAGTGTVTVTSSQNINFESKSCLQKVSDVTATVSGGDGVPHPFNYAITAYYDSDNYNYLGALVDKYSVVSGAMQLPETAKVNDSGIMFTETIYASSTDRTQQGTYTVSYSLGADTASSALLSITRIEKNTSNQVVSTVVSVSRITPSGTYTRLYENYTKGDYLIKVTY